MRSKHSFMASITIPIVVCFFMFGGCASHVPSGWDTYFNEELGIELSYPVDWTVKNVSDAKRFESYVQSIGMDPDSVERVDSEVFSVTKYESTRPKMALSIDTSPVAPEDHLGAAFSEYENHPDFSNLADVEWDGGSSISGRGFTSVSFKVVTQDVVVFQEMHGTTMQGGTILFTLTSTSRNDMAVLKRVLKTLIFRE